MATGYRGNKFADAKLMEDMVTSMYDYIFDCVLLEPIFKIHQIAKMTGTVGPIADLNSPDPPCEEYDIFGNACLGQGKPQKCMEVYCDECNRTIAASRFAPHLEKCMGMGRSSSRVARRRLANYVCSLKGSNSTGRLQEAIARYSDGDHSEEDSRHTVPDDDDDWTHSRRSRRTKKAKTRNRTRNTRGKVLLEKGDVDEDSRGSYESSCELRKKDI
ncbi:hypothetical protein AB6A40_006413 [Gnathostoma spinigerum]|uniref:SAGA-associated factor 11 n=1 Tax=Gnathostoma spinigerum TaxID=75299 RepID=A0ABD6ENH8_9BILA